MSTHSSPGARDDAMGRGPGAGRAGKAAQGTSNGAGEVPRTAVDRAVLEADVRRTRAEIAATLDEITTRLSPRYQASHLARTTQQAAGDARAMVTGMVTRKKSPAPDERRARNAKILVGATLGLVALGAVAVATAALRRARG